MSQRADLSLSAESLSPGTNLLIAGPAMTGKRQLMYELLSRDDDAASATAIVTTRKAAETIEREYRSVDPDVTQLGLVDCVSRQRGFDGTRDSTDRRYVTNAGDLTGIGIRASEFMRRFHEDDAVDTAGVGLHTSSTVLMYTELRRVFQFFHVMTGRVESAGYTGVFVLDTPTADNALDVLKQVFDGLVEVRDGEDGRQLRVRGIDAGPRHWTAF
ncbi:recombinase RecA [Haloarchaeobius sp. HME9146]|uniref:DUF7504 family protein n=1 Tax=Haloarchaeobius sp. HME9146 TaxID=2978732 RepID=UPI0021BED28E|nr:recombinase RecA [Haloarchaeobius sp. HME9146]MCT9094914.1 recombinase RecA [Haloarchaeobius sp. HME9146]